MIKKYLNFINESNYYENIIDDVKDILLELSDLGFEVEVDEIINLPYPRTIGENKTLISIDIKNPSNIESGADIISTIIDAIDRVDYYMEMNNFTIDKSSKDYKKPPIYVNHPLIYQVSMNIFGSATEKKYTLVYKQKDKI
jgi:hypothetical protein